MLFLLSEKTVSAIRKAISLHLQMSLIVSNSFFFLTLEDLYRPWFWLVWLN